MNKTLDARFKKEAEEEKPIEMRSSVKIKRSAQKYTIPLEQKAKNQAFQKTINNNRLEYFKETHDWFTPSQWAYRERKKFLSSLKSNDKKF